MTRGTSTPSVLDELVTDGAATMLLTAVAGGDRDGAAGNSRPATARTATPRTTAAAVANRPDAPRMLASADAL